MLSVVFGLAEILLRVSVGKENSTVTDQDASFLPVGQNGHATAIKVYGIRMGGHMARLGLQDGDTIISINGRHISEHSRGVVRALYLERRLILQIKRDGERRLLYWSAPGE